jgi:hypothetical protein
MMRNEDVGPPAIVYCSRCNSVFSWGVVTRFEWGPKVYPEIETRVVHRSDAERDGEEKMCCKSEDKHNRESQRDAAGAKTLAQT